MDDEFSFHLEDQNGRSLSELSIGISQTLNILSGAEEIDDGGLGEFAFSMFPNNAGSRSGSMAEAGRSFSAGSQSDEFAQIQTIRPHAEDAGRQTVRAVKRKIQESEAGARTGSQELMEMLDGFDNSVYYDAPLEDPNALEIPAPGDLGISEASFSSEIEARSVLENIKVFTSTDAEGKVTFHIKPTSFEAKIVMESWYHSIKLIETNFIADQTNHKYGPGDCRTSSERPFPKPTLFSASRISAAAGRIFGSLSSSSSIIDIRALKERCPRGR